MRSIYILFGFLGLLFYLTTCSSANDAIECNVVEPKDMINGVNLVAVAEQFPSSHFDALNKVAAGWVSFIPYAFIEEGNGQVQYGASWQWYGEKKEGIKEHIQFAKERNLKVMIKPHVWIGWGVYTGDYALENEADWIELESSFRTYILDFADLAEAEEVDLFCIGTEWKTFVSERPDYWSSLIDSVRLHYTGALTYAGNWDAYKNFPHWEKLDYIGIDAYFPVSDEKTPTITSCKNGWKMHVNEIENLSKAVDKKVIFTEYGYRSMDFAGKTPWETGNDVILNITAQDNAYKALLETFYDKDWYAGGFIWKWFPDYQNAGGLQNNQFTPQNKPVESIIKEYYSL